MRRVFGSKLRSPRSQAICTNWEYEKSNLLEMTCGVPHGTVLSSSLFLIYISEIANSYNKLSFRHFADDSNIFNTSDNINHIESVMNCRR